MTDPRPACVRCGSERVRRDGSHRLANGQKVKRYRCKDCGKCYQAAPSEATPRQGLSLELDAEIRRRLADGETIRSIQLALGVSYGSVYRRTPAGEANVSRQRDMRISGRAPELQDDLPRATSRAIEKARRAMPDDDWALEWQRRVAGKMNEGLCRSEAEAYTTAEMSRRLTA